VGHGGIRRGGEVYRTSSGNCQPRARQRRGGSFKHSAPSPVPMAPTGTPRSGAGVPGGRFCRPAKEPVTLCVGAQNARRPSARLSGAGSVDRSSDALRSTCKRPAGYFTAGVFIDVEAAFRKSGVLQKKSRGGLTAIMAAPERQSAKTRENAYSPCEVYVFPGLQPHSRGLGASCLGRSWGLLGRSWRLLRRSYVLGHIMAARGVSWVALGVSW